jgi:hypothetical protein
MPKTFKELKEKSYAELQEIWEYYFKSPVSAPATNLHRPLWYKIQCERNKLKLEQKHITKLNTYASNPDSCAEKAHKTKYQFKAGTQIVKKYKGKEYVVQIDTSNQFSYNGQQYKSLSAVAHAICGNKVSGYDFFGLNNKGSGAVKPTP